MYVLSLVTCNSFFNHCHHDIHLNALSHLLEFVCSDENVEIPIDFLELGHSCSVHLSFKIEWHETDSINYMYNFADVTSILQNPILSVQTMLLCFAFISKDQVLCCCICS